MSSDIVLLSETEQRLSRFIAKKRYANNRMAGVVDRKVGPQTAEDTDLNGVGAEIAFCKKFNLYPDLSIDHHPVFDAVYNGFGVDVKHTRYTNGRLLVALWKKDKPADIYALMVGKFPKYKFIGFALAEDVFKDCNIKNLGYGYVYAVNQSKLVGDLWSKSGEVI